jgi:xanthine dehydrogenase accessory factor
VHAVDPQADAQAFPDADTISTDPDGPRLEGAAAPIFAVVATQGQWDEEALRAAAAREPAYLGLVSSARRFAEMRSLLAGQVPDSILSRVRNPAGLDLGARLPEEIALSILAEVVKERRAASEAPPRRAAAAAEKAVDPVCGMAVEMQDARHTTRHGTRDFYFCCAGCRDRFLSAPERYLAAAT